MNGHLPTLPLREGRNLPFANFGEGCAKRTSSPRPLPEKFCALASLRCSNFVDPPSRGGWAKNSSCFVRIGSLYSQYKPKSSHVRPAPRDSRGDGARTQKTAGKARFEGDGGGGKRLRESNYVAEAAGRRASRQSQRRDAWTAHAGAARASCGHHARCSKTASALRVGRDASENRAVAQRADRASDRSGANTNRLGDRASFHRGGVR
jgi:hypothetical protein